MSDFQNDEIRDIIVERDGFLEQLNETNNEIERLNNIINELEKWIKNDENHNDSLGYEVVYVDELLNRLKELKEEK